MRNWQTAIVVAGLVAGTTPIFAEEPVTADEIIAKVREAAAYLAKEGEAGLATFDRTDSDFVWKDSYIFVYDCDSDVIAAHPVAASRDAIISELRGGDGGDFGNVLCAAAEPDGGSWAEYDWLRPVAEAGTDGLVYHDVHARKVSYMLAVEGTPWQVGAGMFDEDTSIESLNTLLAQ